MNWADGTLIFLDCQTTGASPTQGELLEIAWATKTESPQALLVKQPDGTIPTRIQRLTGITEAELVAAHEIHVVYEKLKQVISENKNPRLVVHYAKFEKPFLKHLFEINGDASFANISIYCTHEMAKRLYPALPTRSIRGLAGFFGSPLEEFKRAKAHVSVTQLIWDGLTSELERQGVQSFDALDEWMRQPIPHGKPHKYEYPLEKAKRLRFSDVPGVYRMMARNGSVLYVGKATSLKSRVNSYFRGQKNRDPRKLEMLTQVWNIEVAECATPLEAALLETDEIKKFDPPYNISLKAKQRQLVFFSRDFSAWAFRQDKEHSIGPFTNPLAFDSLQKLAHALQGAPFDSLIFYEPLPSEDLAQGFELFCQNEGLDKNQLSSFRKLLAIGMTFWQAEKESKTLDAELEPDETINEAVDDTDDPITVEEIAAKFKRLLTRSAKIYLRSKILTGLLNCNVQCGDHTLRFVNGQRCSAKDFISPVQVRYPWSHLDLATYDRMSVLWTEIQKFEYQIKVELLKPPAIEEL